MDKPWGKTKTLYRGAEMIAEQIEVLPGGFCSIHSHAAKANVFYVTEGELYVRQFTADGHRLTCKYLYPGSTLVVPPGIWHQFWSLGSAKAIEVYFPIGGACNGEDIERHPGLAIGGRETSYDEMCRKWRLAFGVEEDHVCHSH